MLGLVLALGAPAMGSAPPHEATLARLDADTFDAREEGEQELSKAQGVSIDDLLATLAQGDLDSEAHRRVARVAYKRFVSTPRAGMGVEFDVEVILPEGVPIKKPVENFPAFELIEPGDVILTADGITLRNNEHLGAIIVSHDPGDVLTITLERAGERITLDVPLGSLSALGSQSRVTRDRLDRAFAQRCARAGAADRLIEGSVGAGLTLNDWAEAELGLADGIDPNATPASSPRREPLVRGGRPRTSGPQGSARDPRTTAISTSSGINRRNARIMAGRLGELARQRVRLAVRLEQGTEPEASLEKIRLKLRDIDARIGEMTLELGAPGG